MNTRTLIILGGAGVGIWYVLKKQREAQAAAAIAAAQTQIPQSVPSFFDVLLGQVDAAVKGFVTQGQDLDAQMKARGAAHYTAWQKALTKGETYYSPGGVKCYAVATGKEVDAKYCPATQLEGWA